MIRELKRTHRIAVVYDGETDPDCWWSYEQCTSPKLEGLDADVTRCPEPNTWGELQSLVPSLRHFAHSLTFVATGLTIDDGPNCSHNAYYDYLREQNQKATLFYIGSNVVDWPLEAQRGLDDGHEICAHTCVVFDELPGLVDIKAAN